MKDQFVNHTQALALKELGYSEYSIFGSECSLFKSDGSHTFYMNGVGDETYTSAPLKQQVFRWFREKHNLGGWVQPSIKNTALYTWGLSKPNTFVIPRDKDWINLVYNTFDEAESACINKLIELVKNK